MIPYESLACRDTRMIREQPHRVRDAGGLYGVIRRVTRSQGASDRHVIATGSVRDIGRRHEMTRRVTRSQTLVIDTG